jgi:tRNA threonylcarbamoyladenosine biosynthesis protein TsaB
MQKGHAEQLLPMVKTVMSEANLEFAALDRIAVTYGPGTFTGTRICISAARALALATGAEIVAISSLRLMAMSALIPAAPTAHVAIATDARRGEVYLEVFDRHSLEGIAAPQILEIENAVRLLGTAPVVIAGSGAEALAQAANRSGGRATAILPGLLPDAFDMLFTAAELPVSAMVRPLYLRPPDAKPPAPSPLVGARA